MNSFIHFTYSHKTFLVALKFTIILLTASVGLMLINMIIDGQLQTPIRKFETLLLLSKKLHLITIFLLPLWISVLIQPHTQSKKDRFFHGGFVCLFAAAIYSTFTHYLFQINFLGSGNEGLGTSVLIGFIFVIANVAFYLPIILRVEVTS